MRTTRICVKSSLINNVAFEMHNNRKELGRATWHALHYASLNGLNVLEGLYLIHDKYPCKTCRKHFQEKFSRQSLEKIVQSIGPVQGVIFIHNIVNISLKKTTYYYTYKTLTDTFTKPYYQPVGMTSEIRSAIKGFIQKLNKRCSIPLEI